MLEGSHATPPSLGRSLLPAVAAALETAPTASLLPLLACIRCAAFRSQAESTSPLACLQRIFHSVLKVCVWPGLAQPRGSRRSGPVCRPSDRGRVVWHYLSRYTERANLDGFHCPTSVSIQSLNAMAVARHLAQRPAASQPRPASLQGVAELSWRTDRRCGLTERDQHHGHPLGRGPAGVDRRAGREDARPLRAHGSPRARGPHSSAL